MSEELLSKKNKASCPTHIYVKMKKYNYKDECQKHKLLETGLAPERRDLGINVLPLRTTKSQHSTGNKSIMEEPAKVSNCDIE